MPGERLSAFTLFVALSPHTSDRLGRRGEGSKGLDSRGHSRVLTATGVLPVRMSDVGYPTAHTTLPGPLGCRTRPSCPQPSGNSQTHASQAEWEGPEQELGEWTTEKGRGVQSLG